MIKVITKDCQLNNLKPRLKQTLVKFKIYTYISYPIHIMQMKSTDKIFGQPHYSPYSKWHVLAKLH